MPQPISGPSEETGTVLVTAVPAVVLAEPQETPQVVGKMSSREDLEIEAGYHIHSTKLGEGGFSKVKLGTHLISGEKVAIKCMDKRKLGQDLFRVKTEIQALKILQHENVAKLYQVIENETQIYLVLEYCSGGELFDYIVQKSRLSEAESKSIMRPLIQCLAYCHLNGFAHRDLKPENILFDDKKNIKLIDFGLAAHPGSPAALSHLKTCCGSPAYAAPELISGLSYSGPAVDVWSAGVLLYALLVGQLPFDDENLTTLYKKIQAGQFPLPLWLSNDVRNLIKQMLQRDPKRRITVKELLTNRWLTDGKETPIRVHKEQIDEEVLWDVSKHFKGVPIATLRQNIISGFGYQTATYWLLKHKKLTRGRDYGPHRSPSTRIGNTRTTKSTGASLDLIEEEPKLNHPAEKTQSNEVLDTKSKADRPSVVGSNLKRKLVLPNTPDFNVYENKNVPSPAKARYTPSRPRQSIIPRPVNAPPAPPSARENTLLDIVPLATSSPKPGTPQKQQRTPGKVLSPVNTNTSTFTRMPKHPNSDSPAVPNKRMRMLFGKSPISEGKSQPRVTVTAAVTPLKQTPQAPVAQTPKRSLLKRLLASATPSMKDTPRNINARTSATNITMTSFTDPQECIAKLVESLTNKGYMCKQKGFVVSCSKTNKYDGNDMLSFNLEICQFGSKCAIQRKRLRGDSWFYKKVCEEILRVSNEHQSTAVESTV